MHFIPNQEQSNARLRLVLPIAAVILFISHVLVLALLQGKALVLGSNLVQVFAAALAAVACISPVARYRDFTRSFWVLLQSVFFLWAVAQTAWTIGEYTHNNLFGGFGWTDLVFFFSFAPFALMVLLTETEEGPKVNWQRVLDVTQVGIVIFCAYLYVFYVPFHLVQPDSNIDRKLDNIFAMRNIIIAVALWVRAVLTRSARVHSLFAVAGFFVSTYAVCTRGANYLRLHYLIGTGNWFDLGWALPFLLVAVLIARWTPQEEPEIHSEQAAGIRGLLAIHATPALIPLLVLFIASQIAATPDNLALASTVILVSFFIYSLRLAVTQYNQQRAVEDLQRMESRFRTLFTHNPLPMWLWDRKSFRFLEVNDATIQNYGWTQEEFRNMTIMDVQLPEIVDGLQEMLREAGPGPQFFEWRHRAKDGHTMDVLMTVEPFELGPNPVELVIAQDITERKELEDQLRQAQKMEAIGTLAGGIAHDFNNLLTVISGYSQVVLERSKNDDQLTREIQQIELAANRATSLTRQLLAFSRRQVLQPQLVNLDNIVNGVERMLRRLIGEHIELITMGTADLGLVKADPGQVEQVLINLAVNARDAMPHGGKVVFHTANVELDDDFIREHMGSKAGSYVLLEVSDNGAGMDAHTRAHIFEPFFTTKKSAGTGLGLSTVYGIVKQSGGYIEVETEPGSGAIFRIYLPRVIGTLKKDSGETPATEVRPGTETILLVEDDDGLRELAKKILIRNGYKVMDASRASEAEQICRGYEGEIHLLVTDVVMPGLGGREMVNRMLPMRPKMSVLFMSGYTDQIVIKQDVEEGNTHFLQKPFTPSALARKVRDVLDMNQAKK